MNLRRLLRMGLFQFLFHRSSTFSLRPPVARQLLSSSSDIFSRGMSSNPSVETAGTKMLSISSKIERTLDPCVVLMKELIGQYADKWEDKGGIFSLAQGVVYWRPPQEATDAMKSALDEPDNSLHLYGPDEGLLELREELEKKVAVSNGLEDHNIMVTIGANQAYVNCLLTLMHDTEKCIVFKPYYFNHVMHLQMTFPEDCMIVGPSHNDGIPDLEWLENSLRTDPSIKVVTLVNPGNPTGTNIPRPTLQKVVDLCNKHEAWLILDCTYEDFVPDSDFEGCFSDPHVLHIFSFSKAYALAGYRCGYVAISKKAVSVYDQMMKVQDTIVISPPRLTQVAALASLSVGKEWVKQKVATLATGRNAILDALKPLQCMGGSGAMYVMAELPDGTDDQELARLLVKDFGVAVIPGSFCGFPGWIRVCYANLPPEKCLLAAQRLASGLQTLCTL